MKLRTLILATGLSILVSTAFGQSKQKIGKAAISEAQTVSFCELMTKPETYVNKIVRVNAVFENLVTMESILYAECDPKVTAVSAVGTDAEPYGLESDDSSWLTEAIRHKKMLTVIGKFSGPKKPDAKFNYGHYGWSKYFFMIYRFEKIERVKSK